jgi:hypothetical protein
MNEIMKCVETARSTKDTILHSDFAKSSQMFIRKALATNPYVSSEILYRLAFDQTVNVSYTAVKNTNCPVQRMFREVDIKNRCIICMDVLNDITKCQRC